MRKKFNSLIYRFDEKVIDTISDLISLGIRNNQKGETNAKHYATDQRQPGAF